MHAGQFPANTCPRRAESMTLGAEDTGRDVPRADGTCSYCGSFPADKLMEMLEAGTVRLDPTDKNYKVYLTEFLTPEREAELREQARNSHFAKVLTDGDGAQGFDEWWMMARQDLAKGRYLGKFYFQHFTDVQMNRFIELYNARSLKFGYPGYLYTMPFFMRPISST